MPALRRQTVAMIELDLALGALVKVLDPDRTMSLYALGGIIERMFKTHSHGLDRIEAGARTPRDEIESALLNLRRAGCPSSQRQLYRLLGDMQD